MVHTIQNRPSIRSVLSIFLLLFLAACQQNTVPAQDKILPIKATETLEIPSIEPTEIPKNTATPTAMPTNVATPTVKSAIILSPTQTALDRVFALSNSGTFLYTAIDAATGNPTEIHPQHLSISPDEVGAALSLSFSHFSDRLAFWHRSPGESGSLWLTDMELENANQVYVDEEQLYNTDTSFPPQDVSLNWFPNDRYLLLTPANPEAPRLFIDTITGEYQTNWKWDCKTVITSPKTSRFALLCNEDGASLVMEWNGELWFDANIDEHDIVWQWTEDTMLPISPSGSFPSWSPDGRKIAYIDPQNPNVLEIVKDSGEKLSVTVLEDVLYPHSIQWADNGDILVFCDTEDEFSHWFVVESNTGEILWSLENTPNYDTSPEHHEGEALIEGAISNSGQYVVLATSRTYAPSGNVFLLFDVKSNKFLGELAGIGRGAKFVWER